MEDTMTNRYRKKPVVIEAMQFKFVDTTHTDGWLKATQELREGIDHMAMFEEWFNINGGVGKFVGDKMHIKTLEDGPNGEAKHVADSGDWIIKGIQGEFYPCKPDIFEDTYEKVGS